MAKDLKRQDRKADDIGLADEFCDDCLIEQFGDVQVLWPGDGWQTVRGRKCSPFAPAGVR